MIHFTRTLLDVSVQWINSLLKKGDKKIINAWGMYDWANSVYSLVITSTIFPIYYNNVTEDNVIFFGREFANTALYAYSITAALLIIALISPILSSIADYSGRKKGFMQFFCYMGSLSCCSMFFFDGSNLYLGIFTFILAGVGWSGSIVFYNSYLPEIAEEKDLDRVSAKGFSMGYIGSVLLLLFNLFMLMSPETFGFSQEQLDDKFPARLSFLLVGFWWMGFAQITFRKLPTNIYGKRPTGNTIWNGYKALIVVLKQIKEINYLRYFLLSFFFYMMGVQTVMWLAATFGEKDLKLDSEVLITTVLVIQLVAILGAYGFSRLSMRIGNIPTWIVQVIIWIGICVGTFYFVFDANSFIIIAAWVGLVMGGIQSLSRSTYAKLLPDTQSHASFFSFYDVCEKIATALGTLSFGIIEELTGSMRNSLLALAIFFLVGLLFLFVTHRLAAKRLAID